MLRILALAAAVVALAGSATSVNQFNQEGTVAAPRAPLHDGQPLEHGARLAVHAGASGEQAFDASARPAGTAEDPSAAAVARKRAGASLRVRGNDVVDLQFEVDGAWSPAATTPRGTPIDAPEHVAVGATVGLRSSGRLSDDVRLGVAVDVGGVSVPVRRDSPAEVGRDAAFVGRFALVPSARLGSVTVFGIAGVSTRTEVPPSVIWTSDEGDPGVKAGAAGVALVYAAGATVELNPRTRLTARIGDAAEPELSDARYAPQVDVGLAFDLDP